MRTLAAWFIPPVVMTAGIVFSVLAYLTYKTFF
jgi:hypothetical protein